MKEGTMTLVTTRLASAETTSQPAYLWGISVFESYVPR